MRRWKSASVPGILFCHAHINFSVGFKRKLGTCIAFLAQQNKMLHSQLAWMCPWLFLYMENNSYCCKQERILNPRLCIAHISSSLQYLLLTKPEAQIFFFFFSVGKIRAENGESCLSSVIQQVRDAARAEYDPLSPSASDPGAVVST